MNAYSIYWIKEPVAKSYFHKSDLLHQFFNEYENDPERNYLSKQFSFITQRFHLYKFAMHLKQFSSPNIYVKRIGNRIQIKRDQEVLFLYVENGGLSLRCSNLEAAVSILFPVLEDIHPFFFVQGQDNKHFGWISPMTHDNKNELQQVLYSYF
ncbi:sporulation inhibitor of replication protein SirA [Oceanobacillus kimchii]|uniref:sporulation inhibitor of replication protein SirA n=1 Tax=Oceanobacillus kimchii TaxID=746691 RepID=UPI003C769639